jgi:hypothetical protein
MSHDDTAKYFDGAVLTPGVSPLRKYGCGLARRLDAANTPFSQACYFDPKQTIPALSNGPAHNLKVELLQLRKPTHA